MNQSQAPIAPATRTLKTLAVVTRLLLWLLLAAWSVFALTWGALHLVIVPRIGEWRPELERWATQAVGVPVRVGAIRAESGTGGHPWLPEFVSGFMPSFELSNVQLLDPTGREALRLPSVRTALSVRSLWRLGFDQVVIAAPVLDVRRTAQGRIEVAGLDFSGPDSGDRRAADWFFAQPEFVIQGGTVRWTDDLRAQPPLALAALDLVVRNTARSHQFRVDATPPPDWGQRFSLRGNLREPLVDLRRDAPGQAPWHNWSGELYADLPQADVARLRTHVDLSDWGVDLRTGQGALRAWADVKQGRIAGVTSDLALHTVDVQLAPQRPALVIDTLQGRLSAHWGDEGFGFATEDLRFGTRDGQVWPGGHLSLQHTRGQRGQAGSAALAAERIDLAALAAIAAHLPLASPSHALLASLQPAGQVEGLRASWQGPVTAAGATTATWPDWRQGRYQAQGRVVGLALTGQDSGQMSSFGNYPVPGRPGIRGATVDFELDQAGGQARVQVQDGALDLPGVFDEFSLPLQRLDADASWTVDGERVEVRLDKVSLANADAQGTAQARWHTSDPVRSASRSRFPGVLDLDATLTRADATRVHRYLPLSLGPEVRRYVREAVRGGVADQVTFRIQGDLWDVPFNLPGTAGEFRIAAQLRDVDLAYVPAFLQSPGDVAWPALQGVQGQLVLERAALRLSGVRSGLDGAPNVQLGEASIEIADLAHTSTLVVSARAQGPASEVLGYVRNSPLNALTGEALAQAQMSGPAQVQFRLNLPLYAIANTAVRGTVLFTGNDVRISPDSPLLARATGTLDFSERGFDVSGAQARLYGGELRFDGGMRPNAQGVPRIQFRGQGTASAEGLRDADLGFVSRLFGNASGTAAYNAQLAFRAGVPELLVTSNLQGMALKLPAPLAKAATDSLPMRFENTVLAVTGGTDGELALTDRLQVDIGAPQQPLAALRYERDISGPEPRVLRGSIAVGLGGGESAPLPAAGVVANVHTAQLDADAWERAFTSATGVGVRGTPDPASSASLSYLPTSVGLRSERLTIEGRSFNNVVVGASREGTQWRANIDADELNGYVEVRQAGAGSAGSVYARLARLELAPGAAREVEQILQQPSSVPALDIAVEALSLSGRRLGRVEIEAVNRGGPTRVREWRLNKLNLTVPEARLSATGNWAASAGADSAGARRTALNFKLDIDDSGLLLARFGREGLVRGGKGRIEGNIGWLGSPLALDHASLSGQVKADIERGQFLKVEPGAAKLLGVLSLQALPRRLVLDFRDVFSEGFAFDFVRGDASLEQGVLRTNNLQMKGVNAAVLMEGSADLARETQDLNVVVVPEINAGTASLIATAINPAVGLGTFLAQLLLRQPLQSANTKQFHVTGSWADPQVEKK
jgi:uncharacterized protein (TIGR02099 family)